MYLNASFFFLHFQLRHLNVPKHPRIFAHPPLVHTAAPEVSSVAIDDPLKEPMAAHGKGMERGQFNEWSVLDSAWIFDPPNQMVKLFVLSHYLAVSGNHIQKQELCRVYLNSLTKIHLWRYFHWLNL